MKIKNLRKDFTENSLDIHYGMALDLTTLEQSIKILRESVDDNLRNGTNFSPLQQDTFRSGIIQNFEVAYEVCWKTMKRWLEENISKETIAMCTRKELFRYAGENNLIDDVALWFSFHKARNSTAHIYSAGIAAEVYEAAVRFVPEAESFLQNITARND
ncbi:MAG: nucleotidyltransferase substrate binding protein [Planctomycetaceae bacterium]|jgi:nucleotidyltransferase substrate binding protein (TIGR01987 family)|nr:nucleotidyltransferase substrate binding protein [Planctomycetaceae bacterium]